MTFGNRLIKLRKERGWTQEYFAEKMSVSRQSVSKWESDRSVPELEKILIISEMFSVSTDYLLKGDYTENKSEQRVNVQSESKVLKRKISTAQANDFIDIKKNMSNRYAFAIMLLILSPIALIILPVLSENKVISISENYAVTYAFVMLFLFVSIAISILIYTSSKTSEYKFMDTEEFDLDFSVREMISEKKKDYKDKYVRGNIIATFIILMSGLVFVIGSLIREDEVLIIIMLGVFIAFISLSVFIYVKHGMIWASYQRLLQEDDFSIYKKRQNKNAGKIASVYWPVVVAIFLGYSFITNDWGRSWIIWPIAGGLFGAISGLVNLIKN